MNAIDQLAALDREREALQVEFRARLRETARKECGLVGHAWCVAIKGADQHASGGELSSKEARCLRCAAQGAVTVWEMPQTPPAASQTVTQPPPPNLSGCPDIIPAQGDSVA